MLTDNVDTPESSFVHYFMGMARFVKSKSKDRNTQVGAVIVAQDQAVKSTGWNGFPRGVGDDVNERHDRPAKYRWTEHAERNSIYNAARHGIATLGSTMYSTHMPCCDCARAIVQSGIVELVTVEPDWNDPHIIDTQHPDVAATILREGGVNVRFTHS